MYERDSPKPLLKDMLVARDGWAGGAHILSSCFSPLFSFLPLFFTLYFPLSSFHGAQRGRGGGA